MKLEDVKVGMRVEYSSLYTKDTGVVSKIKDGRVYCIWDKGEVELWCKAENIKEIKMYKIGDVLVNSLGIELVVLDVFKNSLIAENKNILCNTICYSFNELEKRGYKLKQEQKETVLTMDEIAKKFNVPVEHLKIKKD